MSPPTADAPVDAVRVREAGVRVREVDVLVVGAGPAGLSAAVALRAQGVQVEVVDREGEPGGVPRHCDHPGYGLRDLHRAMSGPAYARRLVENAVGAGAVVRPATTVTHWLADGTNAVGITSPDGLEVVRPRAVLLATGARERPRSARLVAGGRGIGVWTTGELQQAVHLHGRRLPGRAVVVGAELVSYSAVLTLRHAGASVVAMVTEHDRPQTFRAAEHVYRLGLGVPLVTASHVVRIVGRRRVQGLDIQGPHGSVRHLACDTVVFTGDWIPDHELARAGGLGMDPASRAPLVDTALATDRPGVFAAGNLVHPVETADVCALGGRHAAAAVLAHLAGAVPEGAAVRLHADGALAWVAPGLVRPDRPPAVGRFVLWAGRSEPRAAVVVLQGGSVLHRARLRGGLVPGRPAHLGAGWIDRIDPAGGPVVVRADP